MKVTPEKAKAVREDLEGLIKKHGLDVVRWAWNRMATAFRLRENLRKEKKRIDGELEKVESKLR